MRDSLKQETYTLHSKLDKLVSDYDFMDVINYKRFLCLHARILFPLEKKLIDSDIFKTVPMAGDRLRSSALKNDLRILKEPIPTPAPMTVFCDDTSGNIAGILYVLEGSRLGSKLLSHRVRNASHELPVSFLNHGKDKALWSSFLSWLNSIKWEKAEKMHAIKAAQHVFDAYLLAANEMNMTSPKEN